LNNLAFVCLLACLLVVFILLSIFTLCSILLYLYYTNSGGDWGGRCYGGVQGNSIHFTSPWPACFL